MSDVAPRRASVIVMGVTAFGLAAISAVERVIGGFRYVGGLAYLLGDTIAWAFRAAFTREIRLGWPALIEQMVRVGVRSVPIVFVVQIFIGIILALQMAPTLESYGSLDRVANIVAIAVFRELGPLISAIVLSGFAGASIAAEIGAMVESEEIKALRAHALNPIHFLVVPRILATLVMMVGLSVMADVVGLLGGLLTAWMVLDIRPPTYLSNTYDALMYHDFFTGIFKAGVFGLLISLIACFEGFNVRGGAEGVGRATTATVVKSIVALIASDCLFTTIFYRFGW